jgi:hypothetical protein
LKEIKKISKEEKLKNNINAKNNNYYNKDTINKKDNDDDSLVYKKSYSESITKNEKEIINGNYIYKNNNYDEDEENNDNKYREYEAKEKEKDKDKKRSNQREKSLNKSSNQLLRKKLHDLEKAPAPVLNIKGAKSKIECWFDNNSNNNGTKYLEYSIKNNGNSNKPNGQNKLRKVLSCDYDQEYLNKKLENKIENYVDKKLSQLYLKIDAINDIFSIESYFQQKKIKMKKFVNIPYINEKNIYVSNYKNDTYDSLIEDINKEYKNLK